MLSDVPVSLKYQAGLGLIEVLISVLVLAVGLLGFAGLQTQAIRMNYDAFQRTRASLLAEELFDRMRANREVAMTSENYFHDFGDALPQINKSCVIDDSETDPLGNTCTTAELAKWDLRNWLQRLQNNSPGASAEVVRTDGVYLVTIRMNELAEGELAANNSTTESELTVKQRVTFQFETVL
ncbi:type IV pilus modification protein PilV [Saccharospirillum salsuginis]|uniref:Type IV pilin Tt1218-like domain-containing protein n=1 Tax=Saccharospirillum salsuginis TaxID=418750 RepID=A0A918NB17_9GAMM|nr:type IV pilus modification protein PilV [Saccharospirillum salsuginis]GGX55164.1 hypothetical protein GCM10007392_23480 [Saccharospirillum salsuginis]